MAFINTIRKRSGIVVTFVSLALLFFLFGRDIFSIQSVFSKKKNNVIGKIDGKEISITAYQNVLEYAKNYFYVNNRRYPNHDEQKQLQDQVWENLVINHIYQQAYHNLNLVVCDEELIDMIQGNHIHPDVVKAFTDPKTKKFDRKNIVNYLKNLSKASYKQQQQWQALELNLKEARIKKKLHALLQKSIYVNQLEASKMKLLQQMNIGIKYCFIPQHLLPKNNFVPTKKMIQDYYTQKKNIYTVKPSKEIQYIAFPIVPEQKNIINFEKNLVQLVKDFRKAKDAKKFIEQHTDDAKVQENILTLKQFQNLFPEIKNPQKNQVLGPIKSKNNYLIYKIVDWDKKNKQYKLLVLQKEMVVKDQVKNKIFRQASLFAKSISSKEVFQKNAKKYNLTIKEAKSINKDDSCIHIYKNTRNIVRWLYNEAKLNIVSPVFEADNYYLVVMMTKENKSGIIPLKEVSDEIEYRLRKKNSIQTHYQSLQKKDDQYTIDSIASKYTVKVVEKEIFWHQNHLEGVYPIESCIGNIFGQNKVKKVYAIPCKNGLMVFKIIKKIEKKDKKNIFDFQKEGQQLAIILQNFNLNRYVKQLAKIEDNRYKFY